MKAGLLKVLRRLDLLTIVALLLAIGSGWEPGLRFAVVAALVALYQAQHVSHRLDDLQARVRAFEQETSRSIGEVSNCAGGAHGRRDEMLHGEGP